MLLASNPDKFVTTVPRKPIQKLLILFQLYVAFDDVAVNFTPETWLPLTIEKDGRVRYILVVF